MQALNKGKINAFIYDAPILKYLVQTKNLRERIEVLPFRLNRQYYGFGISMSRDLRDQINPVLVDKLSSPGWQNILERYNLD